MNQPSPPLQTFPALAGVPGLAHGFVLRLPGIAMNVDRAEALERSRLPHLRAVAELGFPPERFFTVNQVHGDAILLVDQDLACEEPGAGHDALVTNVPGVLLGIYVADCCAVYILDQRNRACGLAHAGKKGAELEIVPKTLQRMRELYGTDPKEVILQLSPCIRPPEYEIDFAADIRRQAILAGVPEEQVDDGGENTGADTARYCSYRKELGKTGRMLALLGFHD